VNCAPHCPARVHDERETWLRLHRYSRQRHHWAQHRVLSVGKRDHRPEEYYLGRCEPRAISLRVGTRGWLSGGRLYVASRLGRRPHASIFLTRHRRVRAFSRLARRPLLQTPRTTRRRPQWPRNVGLRAQHRPLLQPGQRRGRQRQRRRLASERHEQGAGRAAHSAVGWRRRGA
jgi:hypothetical protein